MSLTEPETHEEAVAMIRERLDLKCTSCGAHGAMIDISIRPPAPPAPDPGPTVITIGDQEEIAAAQAAAAAEVDTEDAEV